MLRLTLIVGLGGAIGSILRYGTGLILSKQIHSFFPYGTFAVNIIGCFLIGLFYAMLNRYSWFNIDWGLFFIVGFCGGLTTFSAFAYENIKLLQSGNIYLFIIYSSLSFLLSLISVIAGLNLFKVF